MPVKCSFWDPETPEKFRVFRKSEDTTLGDAVFLLEKQKNTNWQKAFKVSHVLKYDSVNICRIVFSSNKYRKHKDFLTSTMTNETLRRNSLCTISKTFWKIWARNFSLMQNIPYLYMREHVNSTLTQVGYKMSFLFYLTHNNTKMSL